MTNYKFYYNYQTDTKTSKKTLLSPLPLQTTRTGINYGMK